jgi:hypothetical protein
MDILEVMKIAEINIQPTANKTLHPTATSILFVFQVSISPRMS